MNKICIYIFGIGFYLFSGLQFQAHAEQVYYADLVRKAVNNSYELKIAGVDINIGKANLKEARSEYFPEIKSAFNLEYNKDLTGGIANVTAVGTTILSNNTRYQSLIYLTLSYNLYDFGIRGKKCFIAGKDIDIKKAVYNQTLRDIKLKMTELYSDALSNYKEMKYKEQLLPLYKELFFMKERLYNAGNVNKLEMMDEAIRLARTIDSLDTSKAKLISSLKDISYYTNEEYDIRNLDLEDFEATVEVLPVKEEPKAVAPKETNKAETKTAKTANNPEKTEAKTEAKTEIKTETKTETAAKNPADTSAPNNQKNEEKAEVKEVQKAAEQIAENIAPVPVSKESKKSETQKREKQQNGSKEKTAAKTAQKPKAQKAEVKTEKIKETEPKKDKPVKTVKAAAKKEKTVPPSNPDYIIQQLELEKKRTKTTFESIPGYKEQFASDEEKFSVQEQRIKDKTAALAPVDLTKTPEYLNYKYQIEQKKAELSVLKRKNLPQFAFYSNYAFYGTDKSNPFSSISDIEDRSLAFGITTMMPIFDGFKNKANRERAKLELMRLEYERDQKLSELKNRYQKLQEASLSYRMDFQNKKDILDKLNKKIDAVEKLYQVGLIGKVAFLNEKADLLNQKSELEISLINNISTLKQIETLSEEYK